MKNDIKKTECAVKGLTKRGQAVADRVKNRCTVKNYTKRLYIYKIDKEPVGCKIVNIPDLFPPKNCFMFHYL